MQGIYEESFCVFRCELSRVSCDLAFYEFICQIKGELSAQNHCPNNSERIFNGSETNYAASVISAWLKILCIRLQARKLWRNISMAFSNTFSGGILFSLHEPRVPIRYAPVTSLSCSTKRSAFTVRATQDDYAVTGSRKNTKSHSQPNASTNNAAKTSASAEHKKSWYIAGLRLPEFLLPSSSGESTQDFIHRAESSIERTIFNFRFFALLAISGSLAGSLLCFLNGCVYIVESFKVYWTNCVKGVHTGQVVLRLVEAVDQDRALANSSLFGMFTLKERPRWMRISSLDELKTKLGHVIVMILLVKMFERSKTVVITSGMDLLSYAMCIFLSSASLFVLNNLHK